MKGDANHDALPEEIVAWMNTPIPQEPSKPSPLVDKMIRWRRDPEFAKIRARLFSRKAQQPAELITLLAGSGIEEFVGPISWAIRSLGTRLEIKTPEGISDIPVYRILSHTWQDCRLHRLFQKWKDDIYPPPVQLIEARYFEEKFYIVTDGNHRTEAAKIKTQETIAAEIEEVVSFDPTAWSLAKSGVRHRTTGESRNLAPDVLAAARWLGVKAR